MASWSPNRSSSNKVRKTTNQGILASLGFRSRKNANSSPAQSSKVMLQISGPREVCPQIAISAHKPKSPAHGHPGPDHVALSPPTYNPPAHSDDPPAVPARHHSRQTSRSSQPTIKADGLPAEPMMPTSKLVSSLPYPSPQPSLEMDSSSSLETCMHDNEPSGYRESSPLATQELPPIKGGETLDAEKIRNSALSSIYGLSPDIDGESMTSLMSYDAKSSTASLYVHQVEQIPVSVSSAHTIDYHP